MTQYRTRFTTRAPTWLIEKARSLAGSQGISFNEWVRRAMREKMMDTLEYRDPYQDMLDACDQLAEMENRIPQPAVHILWISCPKCGKRFWWTSVALVDAGYRSHYWQQHPDDLRKEVT
jgi:hypothetical protein